MKSLTRLAVLIASVAGSLARAADPPTAARTLRLPDPAFQYADVDLPAHFTAPAVRRLDNTPASNPVTDAGATLGRVLFYDTRLSANGTVSCASCHQQKHAFSDPNRFSKGFEGKQTDRNTMPLVEVRFYPRGRFFWDERAKTLEEQVLMPIQNKIEMGQDLPGLVAKLTTEPVYPPLYKAAFGDSDVTPERTARAVAQFVRSLVSYRSKYDEGAAKVRNRGEDFPNFSRRENHGKAIFNRLCATCHMPGGQDAVFTTDRPRNNGLDADTKGPDLGVADVTFNRFEAGLFKSPSLRNVEYTGPYMHDGRLKTLDDVVEHYSSGIKPHPNRDIRAGGIGGRGFDLAADDKAAVVAFLKTLSDPKFVTDPRFADPFESTAAK
jgi:cytochrome c peroxidase